MSLQDTKWPKTAQTTDLFSVLIEHVDSVLRQDWSDEKSRRKVFRFVLVSSEIRTPVSDITSWQQWEGSLQLSGCALCMWAPVSTCIKVEGNDAQASVSRDCFEKCLSLHRYVQCSLKAEEERGNEG